MKEEKNQVNVTEELDLDDLEQVSGGTMHNIKKKPTTDVSQETIQQMNQP